MRDRDRERATHSGLPGPASRMLGRPETPMQIPAEAASDVDTRKDHRGPSLRHTSFSGQRMDRRSDPHNESRRLAVAALVALLVHVVLLFIPLPVKRAEVQQRPITVELELLRIAEPVVPIPAVPPLPAVDPVEETAPAEAATPMPRPVAAAPPEAVPDAKPVETVETAPPKPRVISPDGRVLLAPRLDDSFDARPRDIAPTRRYENVAEMYRAPAVQFTTTRYASAYVPYGHAGQQAAFHYPLLRVLGIFTPTSFLVLPDWSPDRDCLRHAEDVHLGECIDGGQTSLRRLIDRPLHR
jgi:hypothetical protein